MSSDSRFEKMNIDECVEAILAGETTLGSLIEARPEFASELVHRLSEEALGRYAALSPAPAFRDDLRRLVVEEARRLQSERHERQAKHVRPIVFLWRRKAVRIAAAVVVLTGLLSGIGLAAASSLPDSSFYPLKKALENARLALERGSKGKAELHVDYAKKRLEEIKELKKRGDSKNTRETAASAREELERAASEADGLSDDDKDEILSEIDELDEENKDVLEEAYEKRETESDGAGAPPVELPKTEKEGGVATEEFKPTVESEDKSGLSPEGLDSGERSLQGVNPQRKED